MRQTCEKGNKLITTSLLRNPTITLENFTGEEKVYIQVQRNGVSVHGGVHTYTYTRHPKKPDLGCITLINTDLGCITLINTDLGCITVIQLPQQHPRCKLYHPQVVCCRREHMCWKIKCRIYHFLAFNNWLLMLTPAKHHRRELRHLETTKTVFR